MTSVFLHKKRHALRHWWNQPPTARDRWLGAALGAMAFFWLGLLARLIFEDGGVALDGWLLAPAAMGMLLGALFPKYTVAVFFTFAFFGGGPGS